MPDTAHRPEEEGSHAESAQIMSTQATITAILRGALAPTALDVIDESHLHAGHSGARPGGETHFRVRITAAAFDGKSRLERHRVINALLADPLANGVHALAIEARGAADRPAS